MLVGQRLLQRDSTVVGKDDRNRMQVFGDERLKYAMLEILQNLQSYRETMQLPP